MRRRLPLIAAALLILGGVGFVLARYLVAENTERTEIVRALERRAPQGAEVKLLRLDSATARTLGDRTGTTRVAYRLGDETQVRCVLVRRRGGPLSARRVSILRVSAPIGIEASCP